MTRPGPAALVAQIHATPTMVVLAVTGGGMASVVDLLSVGGASRTVLEVTVPYAASALADLLGAAPAQATSAATASQMAQACRRRAEQLCDTAVVPVVGVACTAALVSDRPKRGPHRAHVALAGPDGTMGWSVTLDKGRRSRVAEDRVVSDVVLAAVAIGCGVPGGPTWFVDSIGPGDVVEMSDAVGGLRGAVERA